MALSAFGYVFHISSVRQTVAVGSNIRFNSNGPLRNIQHTPGNSGIVVNLAGVYNIEFGITTENGSLQRWAVTVNGIVRSLFTADDGGTTAATSLSLRAGEVVRIRNVGTIPNPVTLESNFRTAWVLINKVD